MKAKQIISFMMILILCLTLSTNIYALEEKETVYASLEKQNEIYSMLNDESYNGYKYLKYDNLTILKESITKVYYVSTLDYARSGILKVVPMTLSGSSDVYVAKTINANGLYAGNLQFYIKDGIAYRLLFEPSYFAFSESFEGLSNPGWAASCSYADHAQRIQKILNRSSFVPIDKVKYVLFEGWGNAFYIEDDTGVHIIPVGKLYKNQEYNGTDRAVNINEIKKFADQALERHNDFIKEKEAWEKEHPGQSYASLGVTGGGAASPFTGSCGQVDNILNISEYLGIDMTAGVSESGGQAASADKLQKVLWITIPACVLLAGAITFICIKKRKKE